MELDHAPLTPFMDKRTAWPPGVGPLEMADWLHRDAAYVPQMAYRDRLIAEERDVVFAAAPEAAGPSGELLDLVAGLLADAPDHAREGDALRRPGGGRASLTGDHPLALLARMAQEDFCLLWKPPGEDEHRLIGAILCFPSRWSLAEKMGKPLIGVHDRVPSYDGALAPRVQRLFDALRPGRPLVRANWLVHTTPELHQPLTEKAKAARAKEPTDRYWLRVERQTLLRLPESGAAVFGIKTLITPIEALTGEERAGLSMALDDTPDAMRVYHGGHAHHEAARAALAALT